MYPPLIMCDSDSMRTTILYHGNCIDGWFSAYFAYCALVEQAIQSALTELSCDASTVLEYAQTYGGDPRADKLLSRLLAFSDYGHFCAMMRSASEQGPIAC